MADWGVYTKPPNLEIDSDLKVKTRYMMLYATVSKTQGALTKGRLRTLRNSPERYECGKGSDPFPHRQRLGAFRRVLKQPFVSVPCVWETMGQNIM